MVSWLDKAQIGSNRGKSAEFSLESSRSTDLGVFKPSERSQKCSDKRFGLFLRVQICKKVTDFPILREKWFCEACPDLSKLSRKRRFFVFFVF